MSAIENVEAIQEKIRGLGIKPAFEKIDREKLSSVMRSLIASPFDIDDNVMVASMSMLSILLEANHPSGDSDRLMFLQYCAMARDGVL